MRDQRERPSKGLSRFELFAYSSFTILFRATFPSCFICKKYTPFKPRGKLLLKLPFCDFSLQTSFPSLSVNLTSATDFDDRLNSNKILPDENSGTRFRSLISR